MYALTFQINLIEPLLATQLGSGEENSSVAFNFIPGSILRGALVGHYLQQNPKIKDPPLDPECRRLFFDGKVRYLNAYPLNRLGERTLPTPLSWHVSKDEKENDSATIYDFAIEREKILENPVPYPCTFCWHSKEDKKEIEIIKPKYHTTLHNTSENRFIKKKSSSTVYYYEAIAAGEIFGGVIISDNQMDLEVLKNLFNNPELKLGGSQNAGYGRIQIEKIEINSNWYEYEADHNHLGNVVVMTLLSDAILLDSRGQPTTEMSDFLRIKHLKAFKRTRVVGGFNRKWGLPLAQMPALQAGSVFVYEANKLENQLLEKLKQEGMGERRIEGFGRVAVNWHGQPLLQKRTVRKELSISSVSLSKENQKLVANMGERCLRSKLDQKLIEALAQIKIELPPRNAQLSRLRIAIRQAWRKNKSDLIILYLQNLKGAKRQFEQARVGKEQFLSWLLDGVKQEKIWENYLKPEQQVTFGGIKIEPSNSLKLEYIARLLDELLKKTIKEEVV